MRRAGFSLIELLVAIIIISILSTVGTAYYTNEMVKARDSKRLAIVQAIEKLIHGAGVSYLGADRYWYGADDCGTECHSGKLRDLLLENDFRLPQGMNNLCYLVGATAGADLSGEQNLFFVASWLEKSKEPFFYGSLSLKTALQDLSWERGNFSCSTPSLPASSVTIDSKSVSWGSLIYIDADGDIKTF